MKKVLLAGTALVGAALFSTPAAAEINLDLGGFFRGYGVYADNDENGTAAAGNDLREFDFRRDAEIHFTGETTTDNGLTVGVHAELKLGQDGTVFTDLNGNGTVEAGELVRNGDMTDEVYLYTSGGWGRVNFGSEDGAAYLLQVGAPSADSNVDGLRTYIQAINMRGAGLPGISQLDYDHADFGNTDRLTYLTPKFSGFQAGISYAPEPGQNAVGNNVAGMALNDNIDNYEDLWEVAARWDGEFEGFGISLGAGFSSASTEFELSNNGPADVNDLKDDLQTWNVGGNVAFGAFSVGAAYTKSEKELGDGVANARDIDSETRTWVVGGAWDNGPYHVGVSYLDREEDNWTAFNSGDVDYDRTTIGAGYTYGPGMTFRGAVAFGERDTGVAATSNDFTQVTIGTDVQF